MSALTRERFFGDIMKPKSVREVHTKPVQQAWPNQGSTGGMAHKFETSVLGSLSWAGLIRK